MKEGNFGAAMKVAAIAFWVLLALDGLLVAKCGWDGYFGGGDPLKRSISRGLFSIGAGIYAVVAVPSMAFPTWWVRGPAMAVLALPWAWSFAVGISRLMPRPDPRGRDEFSP